MYRIIDDKTVAVLALTTLLIVGAAGFLTHRIVEDTKVSKESEILRHFFSDISVEAKAAVVYDVNRKEFLYEKNSEMQWPLASLTKIMTAYVASKTLEKDSTIAINPESIRREGDSGLRVGEHFSLSDLLRLTLVHSSNDGAFAVAAAYESIPSATTSFVTRMNEEAKNLGLTQTYFINEDGLDYASSTSGGYGSARDMAILMEEALRNAPEILEATAYPSINVSSLENHRIEARSTNKGAPQIPGLIAGKTGFTDLAGGNLVVIFDVGPEHPVIAAVLGSSVDGRFEDIRTLVWTTLQSFNTLSSRAGEVN